MNSTTDPVVTIRSGRVLGRADGPVTVFEGIPYAAAPAGELLFDVPRPAPAWAGVRDCTAPGPWVPQGVSIASPDLLESSLAEDNECLNLNVTTPDVGGSGLPVMVWIHPSAFQAGSNSESRFATTAALARRGVVVVAINYRLGAPGFAEIAGAPSNRGLRDQIAALQWVQDNIRVFGGDPDNVTIFGSSAGGLSCALLFASPAAAGLFHRAIPQSSGPVVVADPDEARLAARTWATRLGVEPTRAALAGVSRKDVIGSQLAAVLDFIPNLDARLWGAATIRAGFGVVPFIPVLDEQILPQRPVEAAASRATHGVSLLLGQSTSEVEAIAATIAPAAGTPSEDPSLARALGLIGADDPAVLEVFRHNRPAGDAQRLFYAIAAEYLARAPYMALAENYAAAGGTVFLNEFAWATPVMGVAGHSAELPFLFETYEVFQSMGLLGEDIPMQLTEEMQRAWISFATHGDPGWAPVSRSRPNPVKVFDADSNPVEPTPRADELAVVRASKALANRG
ncbi:carboxylesterase family protein [Nocardia vulneris]|uniref:carboxylesterase/lipase family protein n=1 Tax=Nocardia vulneris TaxID=1141657 RepID=UPI0030CC7D6A